MSFLQTIFIYLLLFDIVTVYNKVRNHTESLDSDEKLAA